MNVPNRITVCRIILSVFLLILMLLPLNKFGIVFPQLAVNNGNIIIDTKYIVCGIIFLVAALTDFLDGYLARKYNMVTDMGKVMDAIADKILVNGVLIILAIDGFISPVVPVVIVCRDIAVDSIKMVAGSKSGAVGASMSGKVKTAVMLVGITLLFFNDIPFILMGFRVSNILILVATVLSVVSGVEYYIKNKKFIVEK
ncbi:MAG: CDP-diacylglycerol--glycerol-3-phosphate 3-phosphatidyltransferase [Bacilli bacterium]|nr:CDP-diacylglycerol--glycerol-3-phosphate 3-phosphatidyltransferase [Bacilli bacterium]